MQTDISLDKWLERLEQLQPDRIELGLERIQEVSVKAGLDNPECRIITVAGTNGKGSTVAYSASILQAMGMSVGVYTSPHFIDFNERIMINNVRASEAELCAAFAHIDWCRGGTPLTYFEFTTLAAMVCFKKSAVDIAVLEVGLGGRLDAVNAWDSDVACITSIGIDHTDWLGDDRNSIGYEKAGVARQGCALVCGEKNPPATIAEHASATDARLLLANKDFSATVSDRQWTFQGPHGTAELPMPAIQAAWAINNAAVAICACSELLGSLPPQSALATAVQQVSIDGRMQYFDYQSLVVLLDVAHNRAAAALLADFLTDNPVDGPTVAVFSCMQDKDATAIVNELASVVDQWFIGQIDYPRAFDATALMQLVATETDARAEVFASVIQAFDAAVAQLQVGSRVVVFGSFHMVGPVLEHLKASR